MKQDKIKDLLKLVTRMGMQFPSTHTACTRLILNPQHLPRLSTGEGYGGYSLPYVSPAEPSPEYVNRS